MREVVLIFLLQLCHVLVLQDLLGREKEESGGSTFIISQSLKQICLFSSSLQAIHIVLFCVERIYLSLSTPSKTYIFLSTSHHNLLWSNYR